MFDGRSIMSMSHSNHNTSILYTLNLPWPIIVGGRHVSKHRSSHLMSAKLKKKSSVVLQPDEMSNSSPSSGSHSPPRLGLSLAQNTIGVIGGVSPLSTLDFLQKLLAWSRIHHGGGEEEEESTTPPFIVCSDPALSKLLLPLTSPLPAWRRSTLRNSTDQSGQGQYGDSAAIVENLRQKRLFLERSGARCIVMPCNISHSWFEQVSDGCSVPFLHVADCAAEELKAANMRPIATRSSLSIGVLAAVATLTAGFYQEKLQNQGFEVVLPDRATMEHTVIPATEAYNRKDMEGARNLLRIALQVLLVRAVNTVILASDDMRDLLPRDDPLLKKCMDPMDSLVRSTIRWAKSAQ